MTGKKCKTTLRALVVVRIIRASPSGRSRIKWWLPSGSHVLPGIQSDTSEYALIFPVPNETHCYDPSWQLLTQWPQASGYIKKDNLTTPEQWESESSSQPVMLALMDDSGVWASNTHFSSQSPVLYTDPTASHHMSSIPFV